MIFRLLLKNTLAYLSKWAIKKHRMKLVVILGINGTEIIKELAYTVLSSKQKVRRIANKPWWDLSIPLSILGYHDSRRNILAWIILILKSSLYLIFGRKNPHTIIINLNYTHKDTMLFWSKFIIPDTLVISNFSRHNQEPLVFIQNTINNGGKIILHNQSNLEQLHFLKTYNKLYLIGNDKHNFLQTHFQDNTLIMKHSKQTAVQNKRNLTFIPIEAYELAVTLGLSEHIKLNEIIYLCSKIDLPTLLAKIKYNLYKSEY